MNHGKPVSILLPAVTSVCPQDSDRGCAGLPLLVHQDSRTPLPPNTVDNKDLQRMLFIETTYD